jgi:hypothetical protein
MRTLARILLQGDAPGLARVLRRLARKTRPMHYSFYRGALNTFCSDPDWVYPISVVSIQKNLET